VQTSGRQGRGMDLYFASLPNNWDETEIKAFHQDIGGDATEISSIKLLPRRAGLNSRAAIVRYMTPLAAESALRNCKGSAGNMEVRFAEDKHDKGSGNSWQEASGNSWQGNSRGHREDQGCPVTVGLRVRNLGNGQTGTVVACRGRTPGTFRVVFDNGQEWEWEVKRFESEDGWPLLDVEAIPATINLRVRCWMDGRCGRIAFIHNDFPQRIWVEFDDGEAGEKDATWFVSENGAVPVGPGHKDGDWMYNSKGGKGSGYGDVNRSWEWEMSGGKSAPGKGGMSRHSQVEDWWSEGWPEAPYQKGGHDQYSWWENEKYYSTGRRAATGTERSLNKNSTPEERKNKGKGKGKGKGSSDLEETALREVIDQLLDESNEGRVWITDWPGRFQSSFGQLRDFLQRHPDKFTIIPKGRVRFTVAFAGGAPPASASADKKTKGKNYKWAKTQKSSDGEAAGGGAVSEEKEQDEKQVPSSKSAMRRNGDEEDADKTNAFDEDENEDSDDPVEDAMRSREDDAEKDRQALETEKKLEEPKEPETLVVDTGAETLIGSITIQP